MNAQELPPLKFNFLHRQHNAAWTIFFFVVLTMVLTGVVILTWEKVFLRPVYGVVESYYPGVELQEKRSVVQQRVEHFFISVTVDAVVVTILLGLVRRQQRQLSQSEEQYRLLFESNPEPMYIVDAVSNRFISVNDAAEALYGYERREFLNLSQTDICPTQTVIAQTEAAGGDDGAAIEPVEFHRHKDGHLFAVEASSHPIEFQGRPAILTLVRDITERRAAEAAVRVMQNQLARNERISALGRAAAQVAHEVKNPLAGLRLYSLHLKTKTAGKLTDAEMAMVDKIADGIARLSTTTEQILNFARPVDLNLTSIDLHKIVDGIAQDLEPQIQEKRIEVRRAFPDAPLMVKADEAAVHSALLNLMLNSVQAMADGGTLTIEGEQTDQHTRLVIRDTGQGMTAEQVRNVFEPFYTTKSQGMGLGMPYAKKIIEQHSGTIVVKSELGIGTEITVELGI